MKYMGDEIGTAKVDSEHYSDFTDTPIPLFRRIRIVTIQDDGTMNCDCYQFEREGIPCAHQGCVATMCYQCCGKGFVGFTHHDISVRWCCAYMHMAYKKTTPPQMQKLFHYLVINDISGPKLGIALPNELVQHDSQTKYPAHDPVKNYHQREVYLGRFENVMSQTTTNNLESGKEEMDEDILVEFLENLNDSTSAHLEDIFSSSIFNADFDTKGKRTQQTRARDSFKQMWEENCAHADNIGFDAVKKLESTMNEFSNWCTKWSMKKEVMLKDGKRKNIQMAQGRYEGTAKRIYNTHHMP